MILQVSTIFSYEKKNEDIESGRNAPSEKNNLKFDGVLIIYV